MSGMGDRLTLTLGEEHAVHLPPLHPEGDWAVEIEGMESAVDVRKLWPADPYPEDDAEEGEPRPPPDVVFMVRATSPGEATIRFVPQGRPPRGEAAAREVRVTVRS